MESIFILAVVFLKLSFAQDYQKLDVAARGHVQYIVHDPTGKREGKDPRTGAEFSEINGSYGVFSLDSEDPEIDPPPSVIEFAAYPVLGEYSITIIGIGPTEYSLTVTTAWSLRSSQVSRFEGVIDSLQSIEYVIHYASEKETSWFGKVVRTGTLRQDLDNCYKLKLLEGKPLYTDLRHRVDKYESFLSKSDTVNAKSELEKLGKKLEEVWEKSKGPSRDPNHVLKDAAYRILTGDVRALLK